MGEVTAPESEDLGTSKTAQTNASFRFAPAMGPPSSGASRPAGPPAAGLGRPPGSPKPGAAIPPPSSLGGGKGSSGGGVGWISGAPQTGVGYLPKGGGKATAAARGPSPVFRPPAPAAWPAGSRSMPSAASMQASIAARVPLEAAAERARQATAQPPSQVGTGGRSSKSPSRLN